MAAVVLDLEVTEETAVVEIEVVDADVRDFSLQHRGVHLMSK